MSRIFTFQHKEVVSTLLSKGVYYGQKTSRNQKQTPESYDVLLRALSQKLGHSVDRLIFGWGQLRKNISVDLIDMRRALSILPFDPEEYLLLEISLEDDRYVKTDFYAFSDLRYFEECGDDGSYGFTTFRNDIEKFQYLAECVFKVDDKDELQYVFNKIEKGNIIRIYRFERIDSDILFEEVTDIMQ